VSRKLSIVTNSAIACVLMALCLVIATTDMSNIYKTVSAPIYSGDANQRNVSIMFNVCTHSHYVRPIMDALTEAGAGSTWFPSGNWVQSNMQLAKEIATRFEIGNHAYTHNDLTKMSEAKQREEIWNAHKLVKAATTVEMNLFAPPSGSFNRTTLRVAESLVYRTIMWSKDKTCCTTRDAIFAQATQNPKNGDFILMHPTANALAALPDILEFYKSRGFGIVPVGRIIR